MGSSIKDNGGSTLNVLVDSPPHTLDRSIYFWAATAQTPSDILIVCGNTVFVNIST